MDGRNTLRDNNQYTDSIQSISGMPISKEDFLVNDQGVKVEPFFRAMVNQMLIMKINL